MTSVEQPVTILPVPEPVKTQEAAVTEAIIAGSGPVVPAKDENTAAAAVEQEEKTTTTIKETEVKPSSPKGERKPFAVLNNLFHRKEKAATATPEKEVAKEETPIVEEAKKEPVVEAAPVAKAPVATESTEPTTAEVESPKKKDGFLDKLKHLVGDKKEKAPKRSKEPEEAKTEEAVKTEEPVVEAAVVESKPEVPVVTDAPLATAETTETPVAAATEEAPKEEEAKKEEPAAKKDKTKIGRRLSARITGIFSSPRKEKSNPLEKTPTEEKKAEEALPAPVDLPKTEETKPDEPVAASSSTSEPIAAVEGPKSTEPVKAEEVKTEEPATAVTAVVSEEPTSEDRTPAIVS